MNPVQGDSPKHAKEAVKKLIDSPDISISVPSKVARSHGDA